MKEIVKKVIEAIKTHKSQNPKATTYTIPLPELSGGTDRPLSDEEETDIAKQHENLKKAVIRAFKNQISDCYIDTDSKGHPIIVVQYLNHKIEYNKD